VALAARLVPPSRLGSPSPFGPRCCPAANPVPPPRAYGRHTRSCPTVPLWDASRSVDERPWLPSRGLFRVVRQSSVLQAESGRRPAIGRFRETPIGRSAIERYIVSLAAGHGRFVPSSELIALSPVDLFRVLANGTAHALRRMCPSPRPLVPFRARQQHSEAPRSSPRGASLLPVTRPSSAMPCSIP